MALPAIIPPFSTAPPPPTATGHFSPFSPLRKISQDLLARLLWPVVVKSGQAENINPVQPDKVMTIIKKIIRAAELPDGWAHDFANPDQLVVVTISEANQTARIAGINLAAPDESEKAALKAMPPGQQKKLYEAAILHAAAQEGRKLSKADIISSALKK